MAQSKQHQLVLDDFKSKQQKIQKPLLYFKDMVPNNRYPILNAKRTTTKFGEVILLELLDQVFFLPRKYNSLQDDSILQLRTQKFDLLKLPQNEASTCELTLLTTIPTTSAAHFDESALNLPDYFTYYNPKE